MGFFERSRRRFLSVMALLALLTAASARAESEPPLAVSVRGPVSFTNVLYHYVALDAEISDPGVTQLVLRVWNPEGKQVSFKTRRHVKYKLDASRSMAFSVKNNPTAMNGTEIFFKSGCETGTWKIEVRALKGNRDLGSVFTEIEIRKPYQVKPADYAAAHALVVFPGPDGVPPAVEKGKIRFIAQLPEDPCFVLSDWQSDRFDFSKDSRERCTRCCYSMALSWLGIDCTPVRMSELANEYELSITYQDVTEKLGNVARMDGDLEELWEHYARDGASPVYIHFTYTGGMHSLLLIARDSQNPELYYALNPSAAVNASAYPDAGAHEHIIPILIEEGKTGKLIQSPRVKKYHRGKLDVICQWRLLEGD